VELIEADALAAGGCKEAYGNGDESKGEVAFPDTCGHEKTPSKRLPEMKLGPIGKGRWGDFGKQEVFHRVRAGFGTGRD